jgi:hypothetical protein
LLLAFDFLPTYLLHFKKGFRSFPLFQNFELQKRKLTDNLTNLAHFSPDSVAGCISNVECSVGGNLELRQTLCTPKKKIDTDSVEVE